MNLKSLAGLVVLLSASFASAQTPETDAPAASAPAQPSSFQFQDGDRVVLIGNTVLEREQRYGSF